MYHAKVMQRMETGEVVCLRELRNADPDVAEDRACEWINDRDLDNQYPESEFFVDLEREGSYYVE